MEQILIACGDVDLLRKIVGDLPEGQFKPIATKKGAGIARKLEGRQVPIAVIHEQLADNTSAKLCQELRGLPAPPAILYLTEGRPPKSGPFDRALKYPVPGPVFRNAIQSLTATGEQEHDLEKWRQFYRELKARLEGIDDKDYFEILGVSRGAPHHRIVKAFDVLSFRYHPDRYSQFRDEKWGQAIYDKCKTLYKLMNEAYTVLTDRRKLKRYNKALANGELRLSSDEASSQDSGPRALTDIGQTAKSKKFLKLAQTDLATDNLTSALQNLKFAQSMESDNEAIAEKIAEIEARLDG